VLQTKHGASRLEALEPGKIEIDGAEIRVSWHKALPLPVFVCSCGRDYYRLYKVSL